MTNLEWLIERKDYQDDECLIWPFARARGYGQVNAWGKIRKAHRVMCEIVYGPPPSPTHQAAHECGKGLQGCVNPKHLKWKTPSENSLDRTRHGTKRTNEHRGRSLLTRDQHSEILALKGFVPVDQLAILYGVSRRTIQQIHSGRVYTRFKHAA